MDEQLPPLLGRRQGVASGPWRISRCHSKHIGPKQVPGPRARPLRPGRAGREASGQGTAAGGCEFTCRLPLPGRDEVDARASILPAESAAADIVDPPRSNQKVSEETSRESLDCNL